MYSWTSALGTSFLGLSLLRLVRFTQEEAKVQRKGQGTVPGMQRYNLKTEAPRAAETKRH
jgi:hypothetical protein